VYERVFVIGLVLRVFMRINFTRVIFIILVYFLRVKFFSLNVLSLSLFACCGVFFHQQTLEKDGHTGAVTCVCIRELEDRGVVVVTGSTDKTIRVWNASPPPASLWYVNEWVS